MRKTTVPFTNPDSVDPRNLLETVAANAAAASRTVTIHTNKQFSHVLLDINTSRTAGTNITITAKKSTDGGTNFSNITSTAVAAGAGTVSEYAETYTTSTDEMITREYDARGADQMTFLIGMASGGASDFITARAVGTKV